MANNITRMPRGVPMRAQQQAMPSQQWWGPPWWDFNGDCDDAVPPFPCPPPGFPPPGCPPWFSGANSPPWYPGANAGVSFGATAPLNPVRGHFWWNGTTLWMFDGAVWVATGGPGIASTTPPSTSAPVSPVPGQQWFNGVTLYVWDGTAWVPVSQTKNTISATAPPAPNAGDTWWDGTQFRIWDGSAWQIVGPGATVGPVPTATQTFSLSNSANLTVTVNTWVLTPWVDSPTINTGAWDSIAHKYTPNRAGYYVNNVYGWLGGSGNFGRVILKNDPGSFAGQVVAAADSAGTSVGGALNASGIVHMNGTTDYLRHWTYDSTGTLTPVNPAAWQVYLLP